MYDSKVLRRIRKCLALSTSNNPHEAGAALRQAKALMSKHGISEMDVTLDSIEAAVPDMNFTAAKMPRYSSALTATVANAMGVGVTLVYRDNKKGKKVMVPLFHGFDADAEIAAYAYEVLHRQMMEDRKEMLKTLDGYSPAVKTKQANYFCEGWVVAVHKKVQEFATQIPPHRAEVLDEWQRIAFNKTVTPKTRQRKISFESAMAVAQGMEKGEQAQIHRATGTDQKHAMIE